MMTNVFQITGFLPGELFLRSASGLAALKTSGSPGPVLLAVVVSLGVAWACSYGLALWHSPSKILGCLRNKGIGLREIRDEIKVGVGTFAFALLLALLVTAALAFAFYATLYQQSYMRYPWWAPLVNSWLSSNDLFPDYRPMPCGVLLGTFVGWSVGLLIGIFMGRRKGAAGILLTSRLHKPLKA